MSSASAAARVLVCGDSPAYTRSLAGVLGCGDELHLIDVRAMPQDAARTVRRTQPDLVVMGLERPGTGGLHAIEEIMQLHPVPVVVLSANLGRGSEYAAAALAAGAAETLPTNQLRADDPQGAAAVALRHRLRRLARASARRTPVQRPAPASPRPKASPHSKASPRPRAVGIGASTGGPGALATILADLPASFPLPILVAQHMADGFIDALVGWLDERTPLPVAVVRAEVPLKPGIWFAPDDGHLQLMPSMRLAVERETNVHTLAPSADVLLESMASALGASAIGVVLTGMGRDGGRGVAAISRAGGYVIAQDEETSIVFGMPRTAIEHGASSVLPLGRIAAALRQLAVEEAVA